MESIKLRNTFRILLLLFIILCAFCQKAAADWQGAVFGQNKQQVKKSFKFETHVALPRDSNQRQIPGLGSIEYFFNYNLSENLWMLGDLYFTNDFLSAVVLEGYSGQVCQTAFYLLKTKYGTPNQLGLSYVWFDTAGNNKISFVNLEAINQCSIIYNAISVNKNGL